MTQAETKIVIKFIIELARTLHVLGTPAHRLESTVRQVGISLGMEVAVFSVPTSLMLSFGDPLDMQTAIIRIEPGFIDLARLRDVDRLLEEVKLRTIDPTQATDKLLEIQHEPSRWGIWGALLGFAMASAAAARFFGGGSLEIIVAIIAGLIVGFTMLIPMRHADRAPLADLIAAASASFLAWGANSFIPTLSPGVVVLASLVVLLPGLTTTLAINELATRNLVSGSARLMQALMGFVALAIGSIIGEKLASAIFLVHAGSAVPLPEWTMIPALIISGIALSVLFGARKSDIIWIIFTGTLGFACARWGGEVLGPEIGVALGALAVGLAGNIYRRVIDAPAATLIVPGIMILVPGGLGFHSVERLFDSSSTASAGLIVAVLTIAAALVAGLLMANLILSPRKTI